MQNETTPLSTSLSLSLFSSGVLLPSKVIHLVIKRPNNFHFHPGDYVFINIPEIAKYEWHPFTISSAPEQEGEIFGASWVCLFMYCVFYFKTLLLLVSLSYCISIICPIIRSVSPAYTDVLWLHIRAVGQWTNRLHGYFEQEQLKCERQRCELRLQSSDGAITTWVCYFLYIFFLRDMEIMVKKERKDFVVDHENRWIDT